MVAHITADVSCVLVKCAVLALKTSFRQTTTIILAIGSRSDSGNFVVHLNKKEYHAL